MGLTVDYNWKENLTQSDCKYLVMWAKEEIKKRQLRIDQLHALLYRNLNSMDTPAYQNEIGKLEQEIKTLQALYIDPFEIQTPQLIGRLPQ